MKVELLKQMPMEELLGLAEAFGIDDKDMTTKELCKAIARELNKDE
jgi:hypothetical protein